MVALLRDAVNGIAFSIRQLKIGRAFSCNVVPVARVQQALGSQAAPGRAPLAAPPVGLKPC